MIEIMWTFVGVFIWLMAFTVGIACILFMAKSIAIDCRELGYGVRSVIRRGRKWWAYRSFRKACERIPMGDRASLYRCIAIMMDNIPYLRLPAECDYAYGKCFTCAQWISESYGDRDTKTCINCDFAEEVDMVTRYRERLKAQEAQCNYALGKCCVCARITWKHEKYCEGHGGTQVVGRFGLPPAARSMLGFHARPKGWTKMDGSIISFKDILPGPITYKDDRGDNCSVTMVDLPVLDEEELIRQKLEKEDDS